MRTEDRLLDHLAEARTLYAPEKMVGLFLQGSQNYGLDIHGPGYISDVDSKLVLLPSFEDIVMNKKAVSTTHVRANDEHIDLKDLRLMLQTFRKQNTNFIEILFTKFKYVNPMYEQEWNRLVEARERIAHYSPYQAVKTMKGIAMEKYHAMEHEYPSKVEVIRQYGYDGKQLHHLLRVEEFLRRYIAGEPYADCLVTQNRDFLLDVKLQKVGLADARLMALESKTNVEKMAENFCATHENIVDESVEELLNSVQYNIMYTSMQNYFTKM